MELLNNNNILTIILIITVIFLIVFVSYILTKNMKSTRYDQEYKKIILDDFRKSVELEIYRLNQKLSNNEEKFRDINHLLIRNEYLSEKDIILNSNQGIQLNDFLISNGITNEDLIIDKKLVFLLTPFNEEFSNEYYLIKDICSSVGLKCIRGDEEFFNSEIFREILKYILKSNLIIANINGRNSNVMYELGIAQALNKPVILITKEPKNIPIDIRTKRFIIYKSFGELQNILKDELIKVFTR